MDPEDARNGQTEHVGQSKINWELKKERINCVRKFVYSSGVKIMFLVIIQYKICDPGIWARNWWKAAPCTHAYTVQGYKSLH